MPGFYICSKLSVLHRVCHHQNTFLSSQVFNSIVASDQCKFLETKIGAELTNKVLELSLRDLKECILKADRMKTLELSENHPSLHVALSIVRENA